MGLSMSSSVENKIYFIGRIFFFLMYENKKKCSLVWINQSQE